ncbi:MAG: arylsulfatase A-like enzyme [Candidatus Paceibacteria bacterium]|jgi:arylsulfatase A-like enzyme
MFEPMIIKKTTFLLSLRFCVGGLGMLAVSCSPSSVNDPQRPVVVLVTMDTTRADYLGCYGSEVPEISPRLDALAAEGALFRHSISQAAVTPVSHASILTGLYPYNHGLRVMHGTTQNRLKDEQVTLSEILGEEGYDTGAFVSAFPVTTYFGFAQGFDHFDAEFTPTGSEGEQILNGMVNTGSVQRHAGETTARALEWMDSRKRPFFIWLHYFDPHDEHVVPPSGVPDEVKRIADDRDRRRALYRHEITYMDGQLGLVFDKLKTMGLWDNSVIVVTSDHGEGLGDHDWWTHGILYQEQVRVPLVVRGPGLAPGQIIEPVVRSIDIVPTIAELVGLGAGDLPNMDGKSLVPLMDGRSEDLGLVAYTDSVNTLVYRVSPDISDNKNDLFFALVIDNQWKYIHHLKHPYKNELYDLVADPAELNNLSTERVDIMERARKQLQAIEFMPMEQLEIGGMPAKVKAQLEALGYLGEVKAKPEDDSKDD